MSPKSTFSYDAPEHSPGYLLWKTTVAWQRQIKKALEPHDISHAQFVILAIVKWLTEQQQQSTQITIVQLSGLDKMTVSKSLKKLALHKLIARVECKQDTRSKVVSLTKMGHHMIEKLVPLVEGIDKVFFGALSMSEQSILIKLFNKL